MIIARIKKDDGTEGFVLGLSKVNIERLIDGQPIHITRNKHGEGVPEGWEISLIYGETEQKLYDLFKQSGRMDKDTKINIDPRLGIDPNT